jgi:putative SOS response-associated peptidase YedK
MCGRYRLSRRKQLVAEYFDAIPGEEEWEPHYNIAPTQPVPVIRRNQKEGRSKLSLLRWGLIPSWDTGPALDYKKIGYTKINARAETVTTTASFREPFQSQRCLIPADGFYEWTKHGKARQPYCFEVGDGGVFAFAGLWDRWTGSRGEMIETCTILTTTPNPMLADIHDRMPVILQPVDYTLWLSSSSDSQRLLRLLVPYVGEMHRYPVSTRVNQVQNDDLDCAKPVELEGPLQGKLFC